MFTTWDSIEVSGVMFQWGRTIGDVWIKSWLFKWRLNDSTIKGLWNCHHHHHLPLNEQGCWGTTDDFTTSFLHFSLFSTALWDLANSRPVHSLLLSSHLFFRLPCLLHPFTVPCMIVLARPDGQETRPYHCSLCLFTIFTVWRKKSRTHCSKLLSHALVYLTEMIVSFQLLQRSN